MIDAIIKELGEHLQKASSNQAFLLIDPLLREPFPVDWEPATSALSWSLPVRHPGIREDQQPRLVLLDDRNVALLEASVVAACQEQQSAQEEIQNGFCIGGWLLTHDAVEGASLASHLTSCMRVPKRAKRLLRWQDRRVLEWMWPILSKDQRATLFGPLIDWTIIDRCLRLQTYRAPDGHADVTQMHLTDIQLQHAERSAIAQDLLRGWRAFTNEFPLDYLEQVTAAVMSVSETRLQNRQDLVLLGAYILQIHPRLTSHRMIREAIAQVLQGEESLSQVLGGIPDPDGWDAIREDLIQQSHLTYIEHDKEVHHG